MQTGRTARRWPGAVALAMVIAALPAGPAQARLASLSPSSATVAPGATTTTVVTVESANVTCITASASSPAVTATIEQECDDEAEWTRTVTIRTAADIQPGSYTVVVREFRGGSDARTFTLQVEAPAPAPDASTTTTAAPTTTSTARPAPTTTRPPPPSTTSTASTASTSTSAPVVRTTAPPAPPPVRGFRNMAELVAAGAPVEGVFLPLRSDGFATCLPLEEACAVGDSALVLVPARTTEVRWRPVAPEERPPPSVELRGLPPLGPVGAPPDDPAAYDYGVPVLDLSAAGGQLRTLKRGLDEQGELVSNRSGTALAVPVAEGPSAAPEVATFLASAPFGRPRILRAEDLRDLTPAVPLFSAASLQVVLALRPDAAWDLDVDLLPLIGPGHAPHLGRDEAGTAGLYVERPAGLVVPEVDPEDSPAVTIQVETGGDGGGLPVPLVGGGVVALAAGAGVVLWRRRPTRP